MPTILSFPYRPVETDHGTVYAPIIPLEARCGKEKGFTDALIDSGAAYSVFTADEAKRLGIDMEKGKPIGLHGICGKVRAYLHQVELRVPPFEKVFRCRAAFSKKLTISYNLLGREGFLTATTCCSKEKERELVLKER